MRRNIPAGIVISNNQYLEKFLYITWSNLTTCWSLDWELTFSKILVTTFMLKWVFFDKMCQKNTVWCSFRKKKDNFTRNKLAFKVHCFYQHLIRAVFSNVLDKSNITCSKKWQITNYNERKETFALLHDTNWMPPPLELLKYKHSCVLGCQAFEQEWG